jgi:hypothetical protein
VEQATRGEKLQVDTVDTVDTVDAVNTIIDLDRQEVLSILRDVQDFSVPAEYWVDRDADLYIERQR